MVIANRQLTRRVDEFVERYECARQSCDDWSSDGRSLGDFLPAPSDPDFDHVVVELLRVDLEYSWQTPSESVTTEYDTAAKDNRPSQHEVARTKTLVPRGRRVDEYPAPFDRVLKSPEYRAELAFEEYRLRLQAGETVDQDEYIKRYDVDTSWWPADADTIDTGSVINTATLADGPSRPVDEGADTCPFTYWQPELQRLTDSVRGIPMPGSRFAGFRILDLIGEGAFSRVYLATQDELAARHVVLKITSGRTAEPQRLAKLQHTHIVPVYSIHEQDGLSAICMPLLGMTTLADVLRKLRQLKREATAQTNTQIADQLVTGRLFADVIADQSNCGVSPEAHVALPPTKGLERLSSRSYEAACVEIAREIAVGLAFAHERGIVHRDLKPANVLLTDDGSPMLLDFNVSDSVETNGRKSLFVGGTLAYMAPEHLRALAPDQLRYVTAKTTGDACQASDVDPRSDVFAFGVILFQMLTGELPYPTDATSSLVPAAIAKLVRARSQPAPSVRSLNKEVPADVEAIVERCLRPDVSERYQTMDEVAEDLRRHQANLPLRYAKEPSSRSRLAKWCRRHPQLISQSSLAITALAIVSVLAVLLVANARENSRHATRAMSTAIEQALPTFRSLFSSAQSDTHSFVRGQQLVDDLFARHPLANPKATNKETQIPIQAALGILEGDEREQLRVRLAELYYLLAMGQAKQANLTPAATAAGHSEALSMNRAARDLFLQPGEVRSTSSATPLALQRQLDWLHSLSKDTATEPAQTTVTQSGQSIPAPFHASGLAYLDAIETYRSGDTAEAIPLLERLRRRNPQDFSTWLLLGDAYFSVGRDVDAYAAYDAAVSMWPESALVHLHRGIYRLTQQEYGDAIDDFDQVLRLQPKHATARLNRAICSLKQGDFQSAETQLSEAIELGTAGARVYFLRAEAREGLDDQQGAAADVQQAMSQPAKDSIACVLQGNVHLKDAPELALPYFERALQLAPSCREAMRNIAHVLAERRQDTDGALEVIDRMITQFGGRPDDLMSRAVLLARKGQSNAAVAEAMRATQQRPDGKSYFQLGCVLALGVGDSETEDNQGNTESREQAVAAIAKAIELDARWLNIAVRDPDLRSLRNTAEFRQLIRTAGAFQRTLRSIQPVQVDEGVAP